MKKLLLSLLFTLAFVAWGQELKNLLVNPDFTSGLDNWEILNDENIGTATPKAGGGIELNVKMSKNSGLFKLQQAITTLQVGTSYRLYFTAECEKPQTRSVVISYRMRNKSQNLGFIKWVPLVQGTQKVYVDIIPGLESDNPNDPPVLAFYLGELDGKVTFSDMTLLDLSQITPVKPPFADKWTIFGVVKPDVNAYDAIPETLPGLAEGKIIKPFTMKVPSKLEESKINLRLEVGQERDGFKNPAMLYNEFEATEDKLIPVGFGSDWYMELYMNGKLLYSTMKDGNMTQKISPANHLVFLPVRAGKNLFAVKVLAGSQGWRFCWGAVQPPPAPQRFTAAEGYHPMPIDELAVKEGSALDLSAFIEAPAGKYGKAILLPNGHIGFENNRTPQRFFGFSGDPDEQVWRLCSRKTYPQVAAEYARAIRAQGYNLFRMHGFDEWVMANSKEDMKPTDFYMDRWDRLVYEMKQHGVYCQLNLFAFSLFSTDKERFAMGQKRQINKCLFIVGEPKLRARFAEAAKQFLNHVNPYTGLAWKDDPVFVGVEYYNELGLNIESLNGCKNSYPADYKYIVDKWRTFLQKKYAPETGRKCPYPQSVMDNPPLPKFYERYQLRVDFDEFWYENMKEAYRFCDQVMKDCGYKGLTIQCPMPALRETAVSWEAVQIVDGHGYHAHPDQGEQPGSNVDQSSSLNSAAITFRRKFGSVIYGRPFFYNENNFVFRNPYQYEKPMALDAYAAFNDWDSLAIHAGAVALKNNQRLSSFHTANNPVLRAGEFMASLFFLRRDVTPAQHKIAVALNKDYIFSIGKSSNSLSTTQSRLALLTHVSAMVTDLPIYNRVPTPSKPDMTIRPADDSAEIVWHGWYAEAKDGASSDPSIDAIVKDMRQRGMLPADNITDLEKQIYQSETGELTLFAKEKKMTIITPKSEAITLTAGAKGKLATLDITKNTVNSMIGLASVDNQPLTTSKRMVMVLSTRVANTNMQHDPTGEKLRVIGSLPILYQCGDYEINIARKDNLRCWALSITGERMEEIPLKRTANGLQFSLDMASLKNGPTPFFELAAE